MTKQEVNVVQSRSGLASEKLFSFFSSHYWFKVSVNNILMKLGCVSQCGAKTCSGAEWVFSSVQRNVKVWQQKTCLSGKLWEEQRAAMMEQYSACTTGVFDC